MESEIYTGNDPSFPRQYLHMKTGKEDIELIERFLSGMLNHDELVDFETRLEEDHEFARKLRLRKAFPSLFNAQGKDLIIQDIKKNVEEKITEKKVKKEKVHGFRSRNFVWIGIIALAALCLVYILWIRPEPAVETAVVPKPAATQKQAANATQPSGVISTPAVTLNVQSLTPSTPAVNTTVQSPTPVTTPPPVIKANAPARNPSAPAVTSQKAIELQVPEDNMVFERNEDILFRWKQKTDSFTNFYIISEANNKLAWWRGIRPGIRELTVPAVKFKPGKFYWYVGTRENRRMIIIAP